MKGKNGFASSWMAGSVGVSSHWTADTLRRDGSRPVFAEAVAAFDVQAYADAIASAGGTHCIFTLAHARQFLPMPLSELDRILLGRTANRDLVADLIEALSTRGIRFIADYNHSCNGGDDPEWKKACGYAAGRAGGGLDRFAANICGIVGAISQRYGDGIDGWWFDSGYSVDPRGPLNTVTCDMGDWRFPWGALADAAQSGNRDAALAFNSGVHARTRRRRPHGYLQHPRRCRWSHQSSPACAIAQMRRLAMWGKHPNTYPSRPDSRKRKQSHQRLNS